MQQKRMAATVLGLALVVSLGVAVLGNGATASNLGVASATSPAPMTGGCSEGGAAAGGCSEGGGGCGQGMPGMRMSADKAGAGMSGPAMGSAAKKVDTSKCGDCPHGGDAAKCKDCPNSKAAVGKPAAKPAAPKPSAL